MTVDKQKHNFGLLIQKKNPKKNAKQYELTTIQDIFDILTEKNINRFMKEFKLGMKVGLALRNIMKEKTGVDGIENKDILQMPHFIWIDD